MYCGNFKFYEIKFIGSLYAGLFCSYLIVDLFGTKQKVLYCNCKRYIESLFHFSRQKGSNIYCIMYYEIFISKQYILSSELFLNLTFVKSKKS